MGVKVVRQREQMDCGICALQSVFMYYGGYISLEKLRKECYVSNKGTTALSLVNCATKYGLTSYGLKMTPKELYEKKLPLPLIAHVLLANGLLHYVVIEELKKDKVFIMDPALGKRKLSLEEFFSIWTGNVLVFHKKDKVVVFPKEATFSNWLIHCISGEKKTVAVLLFITLFSILFESAFAFYLRVGTSFLEYGKIQNQFFLLLFSFGICLLLKEYFTILKAKLTVYLSKNLDVSLFDAFVSQIYHIPLDSILVKNQGEITKRLQELVFIRDLIVQVLLNAILSILFILFVMILLFFINRELSFIALGVFAFYLIIGILENVFLKEPIRDTIATDTQFQITFLNHLKMIATSTYLNRKEEAEDSLKTRLYNWVRKNFWLQNRILSFGLGKEFILSLLDFLLISVGIYFVYKQEMDIYNLFLYMNLLGFLKPSLEQLVMNIPKMFYANDLYYKLMDFFSLEREKEQFVPIETFKNGDIVFRDVCFSYDGYKNVLDHVNLTFMGGKHTLVTGASGIGKSTICLLLMKIKNKKDGEIFINQESIEDYSICSIRNNMVYLSQGETLFSDTLYNNIVYYKQVDTDAFLKVAKICELEEIVCKRPLRYETLVSEEMSLSGGEKQRILLARTLLEDREVYLFDEVLSEVSLAQEKRIMKSLHTFLKGKTIIYISHREIKNVFDVEVVL